MALLDQIRLDAIRTQLASRFGIRKEQIKMKGGEITLPAEVYAHHGAHTDKIIREVFADFGVMTVDADNPDTRELSDEQFAVRMKARRGY